MSFVCERLFSPLVLTFAALALAPACSGSEPADPGSQTTGGTEAPMSSAAGGSSANGGSKSTGGTANGGSKSTGGAATGTAPTWSELFDKYFAAGTAGDCVSSGCHSAPINPSFNSAATMCSVLKSRGIISNGTASFESLLKWFGEGGQMPMNNNPTPPNAVADIAAWEKAGAVCP